MSKNRVLSARKRLRPFFKYFGSKYHLAPKYPTPVHDEVVELFAGSAQYATLYHERQVLLVESQPDVAGVWAWLVSNPAEEIAALPVDLPQGADIRTLGFSEHAANLIRLRQRVGRSSCWTVSKWSNKSGFWTARDRDAIAAQCERIQHWRVLCANTMRINPVGLPPATWFIDPPYQRQVQVYGCAPIDYDQLRQLCWTLRGQVIVCEGPGADWLPFRELALNRVGRTSNGGTRAVRPDLVWANDFQA